MDSITSHYYHNGPGKLVIVLPEFSSIDVDAVANVTVGALSLSVIVMVTACGVLFSSTPVFPETPLIDIVAVSLDVAS